MTELQECILDVFTEFKRVCEENGLHYYAIGGTCLGAIRHQGFIPWDDDLDVAMPWDDYQKFRKHWRSMIHNPYKVLDYDNTQHFEVMFLKMFNGSTTFIEKRIAKTPDRYTGVFIDIMPIVGFPDDERERESHIKKCYNIARLNASRRFEVKFRPTVKSKIFTFCTKLLLLAKPFNYFSNYYERVISKYHFSETMNVFFPWRIPLRKPYKNVFPYIIFSKGIDVPFENTEICVPQGYDQYLTMDFGNYMQLPPENKRSGGHDATIIDFNKPYTEYQEAVK